MYIPISIKKEINRNSQHDLNIVILLDNVQYSRNVAEIFQLAEAYRVKQIILSGSSAKPPFGKDLQKASLRSETKVQWTKIENSVNYIVDMKAKGYEILSYAFSDNSVDIGQVKPKSNKVLIVFGNETNGLSKEIMALSQYRFFVPHAHDNSFLTLNFSVALTLNTLFNSSRLIK